MTTETLSAPVSLQPGYVAVPPSECLNGCQRGTGPERGPVLAEGPQLLCKDCAQKLAKWLKAIPDAYALLDDVRDHGAVPADPGTKHTKRPDAPAPMRLEVDDLLDDRRGYQSDDDGNPILSDNRRGVLGLLHGWATVVRRDRNQPARCTCGHMALGHRHDGPVRCTAKKCKCEAYEPIKPTVTAECQLLVSNLPWIVEQDFAGDLYEEIRVLNRTLTDTIGDYRAKPVGKCPKLVQIDIGDINDAATRDVPCGGALVLDREGEGVRCVTCGNTVRADRELREMGLIVGRLWDEGAA